MSRFINDLEEAAIAPREGTERLAFWGNRENFSSCFALLGFFNHVYIIFNYKKIT